MIASASDWEPSGRDPWASFLPVTKTHCTGDMMTGTEMMMMVEPQRSQRLEAELWVWVTGEDVGETGVSPGGPLD